MSAQRILLRDVHVRDASPRVLWAIMCKQPAGDTDESGVWAEVIWNLDGDEHLILTRAACPGLLANIHVSNYCGFEAPPPIEGQD
jgi:hypothetical protein